MIFLFCLLGVEIKAEKSLGENGRPSGLPGDLRGYDF